MPDRRQADAAWARTAGAVGPGSRSLRQFYARVGKYSQIKHQRYAHAHLFNRANKALRTLRTYLGRVIRDIERKIKGRAKLEGVFARPLHLAGRGHRQVRRQRGPKVYSLHP